MSARLLGVGFACNMGTSIRKLILLKLIDACEEDGTRIYPAVSKPSKQTLRVQPYSRVWWLLLVLQGEKAWVKKRGPNSAAAQLLRKQISLATRGIGWEVDRAELPGYEARAESLTAVSLESAQAVAWQAWFWQTAQVHLSAPEGLEQMSLPAEAPLVIRNDS